MRHAIEIAPRQDLGDPIDMPAHHMAAELIADTFSDRSRLTRPPARHCPRLVTASVSAPTSNASAEPPPRSTESKDGSLAKNGPQIGGDGAFADVSPVVCINSYIVVMATVTAPTSYREQAGSLSKLYWLDIDVNFKDILRQQRMISSDHISRLPHSSPQYSVLNGVGTVANALSVGDSPATFNRFEVDVAAFLQTDENFEQAELNRSAKMIWNDVDIQSPRLKIYVQPKMLRHLVELYVTKRIDTIIMSMKIAVTRQPLADTGASTELLPVLDSDQRLYFRRTQCELLSVHASLARESSTRQS